MKYELTILTDVSSYELSINKHIAVNLCSPKSILSNNYFLQEPKTLEAHIFFIICRRGFKQLGKYSVECPLQ